MALPKVKPAHQDGSGDGSEPMDRAAAEEILQGYRRDPTAMQSLRQALWATNEYDLHKQDDHAVVAAAKKKLSTGHLKAKKDPCDTRDEKNRKYRDFIDAHRDDAGKIAETLKNTLENILGLSALESSFGGSRFAEEGNNFFGLHGNSKNPLPNQKGLISAKGDPNVGMAIYESYLACAESFAQTKGQLIIGITDRKEFATILQKQGKFGIGPKGPLPEYVGEVVNVIGNVAERLNCK